MNNTVGLLFVFSIICLFNKHQRVFFVCESRFVQSFKVYLVQNQWCWILLSWAWNRCYTSIYPGHGYSEVRRLVRFCPYSISWVSLPCCLLPPGGVLIWTSPHFSWFILVWRNTGWTPRSPEIADSSSCHSEYDQLPFISLEVCLWEMVVMTIGE